MSPTLLVTVVLLVLALVLLTLAQRRVAGAVVELASVTSGLSALSERVRRLDERNVAVAHRHGEARRALARQPRR